MSTSTSVNIELIVNFFVNIKPKKASIIIVSA